jgi:hypothetical protein
MKTGAILTMRYLARTLSMGIMVAALGISVAACNNQTGFSGSVGSTPNGPKLPSFQILGTAGTPFTATIQDARSLWTFQGTVPLFVALVNPPSAQAQMIVTKTSADPSLQLSALIITGNHIKDSQQTMAPFGMVQVQIGKQTSVTPPPADPDLRIFLSGPFKTKYQALVEDINTGSIIQSQAPTLIVFDTPDGKVDATFFGPNNHTTFTADMTLGGLVVVPTTSGGPNLTIRQP